MPVLIGCKSAHPIAPLQLRNTRTADNKSTLLHFLVEHILDECPEALAVVSELAHIEQAAKGELGPRPLRAG